MMQNKRWLPCRERDLDADEEYDVDGGLDLVESRSKKGTKVTCHKAQQHMSIGALLHLGDCRGDGVGQVARQNKTVGL